MNDEVHWYPDHIKRGRYGNWLENNVDWALSRERYWGTPLPIWRCTEGHATAVGSLAELGSLAGRDFADLDPHRPTIDEIAFPCPACGAEARRVPEVIDAWYDSERCPSRSGGSTPSSTVEESCSIGASPRTSSPRRSTRRGLVLHVDGGRGPPLRFDRVSQRRVLRLHRRRAGPEDVEIPRQRDRPPRRDGAPRRRRAPLGPADERLAVVVPAARRVCVGGGRPAVPADALERLRVLRPVRERRGFRPGRAGAGRRLPTDPRPVDPVAARRHGPRGPGPDGRLRRHGRGPDDPGVRRRSVQLVRAPVAPSLLGSRWARGVDTTAAFSTLHECLVTTATLLGPFTPFIAEELWSNLAAGRAAGPTLSTSRTTRPCTRRRWTPGWTTRWPWLGRSSSSAVGADRDEDADASAARGRDRAPAGARCADRAVRDLVAEELNVRRGTGVDRRPGALAGEARLQGPRATAGVARPRGRRRARSGRGGDRGPARGGSDDRRRVVGRDRRRDRPRGCAPGPRRTVGTGRRSDAGLTVALDLEVSPELKREASPAS